MDTLSRAPPKELAHDYLEREPGSDAALVSSLVVSQWEKERKADPESPSKVSLKTNHLDAKQQAAAERWLRGRSNPKPANQPTPSNQPTSEHDHSPNLEQRRRPERTRGGPEDDL
jgi:hypothetical protein